MGPRAQVGGRSARAYYRSLSTQCIHGNRLGSPTHSQLLQILQPAKGGRQWSADSFVAKIPASQ
jgi:hypothetical protein